MSIYYYLDYGKNHLFNKVPFSSLGVCVSSIVDSDNNLARALKKILKEKLNNILKIVCCYFIYLVNLALSFTAISSGIVRKILARIITKLKFV